MRSVGSAVASALIVSLLTAMTSDRTGLPTEGSYVLIFVLGAVAFAAVAVIGLFGGRDQRRVSAQEEREAAAVALAGEFSEVSGLSS
jgi:hypothetical protein